MPPTTINLTRTDRDRLRALATKRRMDVDDFALSLLHHAIQRAWEAEGKRERECGAVGLGISYETATRMPGEEAGR